MHRICTSTYLSLLFVYLLDFSMESKIFLHKDLVPFRLIPVFSIAVVNSTVYFLLAVVGIEECSVCVCVCVCVSYSVVSDSLPPHGLQPTWLLCPWGSSGKNTGVGCHIQIYILYLTHLPNSHASSISCLLNLLEFLYR